MDPARFGPATLSNEMMRPEIPQKHLWGCFVPASLQEMFPYKNEGWGGVSTNVTKGYAPHEDMSPYIHKTFCNNHPSTKQLSLIRKGADTRL